MPHVQVEVRIRPCDDSFIEHTRNKIIVAGKVFTFSAVHYDVSQKELFKGSVLPYLKRFVSGENSSVIAYGQTGSGKTYTMGISTNCHDAIVQNSLKYLYSLNLKLIFNFIEIYNENTIDLLNNKKILVIRQNCGHAEIVGLSEHMPASYEDAVKLIERGCFERTTKYTKMNKESSRSHAILGIILRQGDKEGNIVESKMTFVDLAGSERLKRTECKGKKQEESININGGLLSLGNVINALYLKKKYVPYRDSKLTRILESSIKSNLLMIACVSSDQSNLNETINTLKYASRASHIMLDTKVNIKIDRDKMIINELKKEISKLKEENKRIKETHFLQKIQEKLCDKCKKQCGFGDDSISNVEETVNKIKEMSVDNFGNKCKEKNDFENAYEDNVNYVEDQMDHNINNNIDTIDYQTNNNTNRMDYQSGKNTDQINYNTDRMDYQAGNNTDQINYNTDRMDYQSGKNSDQINYNTDQMDYQAGNNADQMDYNADRMDYQDEYKGERKNIIYDGKTSQNNDIEFKAINEYKQSDQKYNRNINFENQTNFKKKNVCIDNRIRECESSNLKKNNTNYNKRLNACIDSQMGEYESAKIKKNNTNFNKRLKSYFSEDSEEYYNNNINEKPSSKNVIENVFGKANINGRSSNDYKASNTKEKESYNCRLKDESIRNANHKRVSFKLHNSLLFTPKKEKQPARFDLIHTISYPAVSMIYDNQTLIFSTADNQIRKIQCKDTLILEDSSIRCLSGSQNILFYSSRALLKRFAEDSKKSQLFYAYRSEISAIKLYDNFIFTGHEDGSINALDIRTNKILYTVNQHKSTVFGIEQINDLIYSCSRDHTIKYLKHTGTTFITNPVWELNPPHYDTVSCIFRHSNNLISLSRDCAIKTWKDSAPFKTIPYAHDSWIKTGCSLSTMWVTGDKNGSLRGWAFTDNSVRCIAKGETGLDINCMAGEESGIWVGCKKEIKLYKLKPFL